MDAALVCAALLDPERGGSISLSPTVPFTSRRRYVPGTMVLETTFTTAGGTLRVIDSLNFGALGTLPWTELVRTVEVDEGEVPLAWVVKPGHCLSASKRPWAYMREGTAMLLVGDYHLAVISAGLGVPSLEEDRIAGEILAQAGQSGLLAVVGTRSEPLHVPHAEGIRQRAERTVETWRHWSGLVGYEGRRRDLVLRSALVLKALTLKSSGAIAGAATTSLPEQLGGQRNFDYRFAWIRDASFALDAMARLGLSEELHAGVAWLLEAVAHEAPALRVFYDLHARPVSAEMTEVQDVPGYRGSLPVNVGNGAASQSQLGAYGDLLDAVWVFVQHGGRLTAETGTMLAEMVDHLADIWSSADAGLWELGTRERYTSSKLGCWVAMDRAVRLAEAGEIASRHVPRWQAERERIREYIDDRCWSEAKQAYTFFADTEELDAAVLLMARTGFCETGDARLSSTIDAIIDELLVEETLVYRYSGQQDEEGVFLACSCWLVEALVHVGRVAEAERRSDRFIAYANDVGLLTEELDPSSGELRGNLPQALTHLALIGAATSLNSGQPMTGQQSRTISQPDRRSALRYC
ncbi:MAG: glycoside hydrolase family 15 protein [Solirubrobacteraceae bacterium]